MAETFDLENLSSDSTNLINMLNISTNDNLDLEEFNSIADDPLYWLALSFFISYMAIFALGFLGNIFTIAIISWKKMYKKVTFTAILLLATVDLFALTLRLVVALMIYQFENVPLLFNNIMAGALNTSIVTSNLHVLILLRVRYLLIVRPLKSRSMAVSSIFKQSGIAWSLNIICGLVYGSTGFINLSERDIIKCDIIVSIIMLLMVLVPVSVFHYKKIKVLRRMNNRRSHTVSKMNVVMIGILTIQITDRIVATLPWIIAKFYRRHLLFYIFYSIAFGIEMINHSANPVIYFFAIACKTVCKNRRENQIT